MCLTFVDKNKDSVKIVHVNNYEFNEQSIDCRYDDVKNKIERITNDNPHMSFEVLTNKGAERLDVLEE